MKKIIILAFLFTSLFGFSQYGTYGTNLSGNTTYSDNKGTQATYGTNLSGQTTYSDNKGVKGHYTTNLSGQTVFVQD